MTFLLGNLFSQAVLWIRIRIQEVPGSVLGRFLEPYTDPDPHMQIEDKMEANDVRFKIIKQFRDSSDKQFLYVTECAYSEKKDLIKLFFSKIIFNIFFQN